MMGQDIDAICVKWKPQHLTGLLCVLWGWGHASVAASSEEWASSARLPRAPPGLQLAQHILPAAHLYAHLGHTCTISGSL